MHHQRRKSGNKSTTDVREASTKHSSKSSRPAPLTRRTTPQTAQKLGRNPRDREQEWDEDRWFEDERESFPQYCMACEKQFVPQYENIIYCCEECRLYDQENTTAAPFYPSRDGYTSSHSATANYSFYATGNTEPRDIIPRASPSRPSQSHFSPPTPPSSADQTSDAIKALRSLSIRPSSPPTPSSTYHPSIWPFTKSAAASPGSSYTRPSSGMFSSTYDGGYYSATGYGVTSPSTDRPLPSRRPGGPYSRPKSIELVMPMIGGH